MRAPRHARCYARFHHGLLSAWRNSTRRSPRTWSGLASSGRPASWCRRRPWSVRARYSRATRTGSGCCANASPSAGSARTAGCSPGCRTSGRSRRRCSGGDSRPGDMPGPTTARFRPSSKRRCMTPASCCVPTSRCASATPGRMRPAGNCWCACSGRATTSTTSPAAAAGWRCRRTAGWNGCCGRPAYRPVCCSTAARYGSSPRRAAKAPAGSTCTWPTW